MKNIIGLVAILTTLTLMNAEAATLNGAGSSLAMPLYTKWIADFEKTSAGTKINYNSIGSGAGIRQFIAKTVDFGATDAFMSDEELKLAPGDVLHIPMAMAAVVVTYNVPGIKGTLNLDAETIRDIYVGKILRWNDAAIQKLNPTLKLPNVAIVPVYRADGSGTTAIFSDYLSKADATWKTKMGSGKSLNWPMGMGAKGNEGVSGMVKSTEGAVGYVESTYASENSLPVASIKNSKGTFVTPALAGITAAAEGTKFPKDFRTTITNASGKSAYPIAGLTFALIYKKLPAETGKELVSFFKWSLTAGQKTATEIGFAPLPEAVRKSVEEALSKVSVEGTKAPAR
jgi:phosphate transport system substrate-binding protein